MMVTCMEQLEKMCDERKYAEVAQLILAFEELQNFFKDLLEIAPLKKLMENKSYILKELKKLIIEDYESYYKNKGIITEEIIS